MRKSSSKRPEMIKKYLLKNRHLSLIVALFTLLQAGFAAGLALAFEQVVGVAEALSQGDIQIWHFVLLSGGLLLYILALVAFDLLRRRYRSKLITRLSKQINQDYFDNIMALDIQEFGNRETGYYISRITSDIPSLINDYIIGIFSLFMYISQSIFIIIIAIILNWVFALVLLFLSSIVIIYTSLFRKQFQKLVVKRSDQEEEFLAAVKSTLEGFDDVKTNNAEETFKHKFNNKQKKVDLIRKKWYDLEAFYGPGNTLLTFLMQFSAIVVSCLLFAYGNFTISALTSAIYISTQFFDPISSTFELLTHIRSNRTLAIDVWKDFDLEKGKSASTNLEFTKNLKLEEVSFKYDKNNYIFKDINLEITKGKNYLLLGPSGTGKSTFLKIIDNSVNYEGKIFIDEIDLSLMKEETLYHLMSHVYQEPYIFEDTIRANIDLAAKHSDDEIMAVIELTGLTDFMKERTLNTVISEEVNQISGGEKQKICIARALIRQTQILLLDEITAALDQVAADAIENLILSFKEKTILYIAHKVTNELVAQFDYVIRFNEETIEVFDAKTCDASIESL